MKARNERNIESTHVAKSSRAKVESHWATREMLLKIIFYWIDKMRFVLFAQQIYKFLFHPLYFVSMKWIPWSALMCFFRRLCTVMCREYFAFVHCVAIFVSAWNHSLFQTICVSISFWIVSFKYSLRSSKFQFYYTGCRLILLVNINR